MQSIKIIEDYMETTLYYALGIMEYWNNGEMGNRDESNHACNQHHCYLPIIP